jgi:hypothetical protein
MTITPNHPPSTPGTPFGPTSVFVNEEYTYFIEAAVDPEGDKVQYIEKEGDNILALTDHIPSGENLYLTRKYGEGETTWKVRAEDEYEAESGWSGSITVTARHAPDLRVYNIWTSPGSFAPGEIVEISAKIINEGTIPIDRTVHVSFYKGNDVNPFYECSVTPSEVEEGIFLWSDEFRWWDDKNSHEIRVVVDEDRTLLEESDYENNEFSKSFSAIKAKMLKDTSDNIIGKLLQKLTYLFPILGPLFQSMIY